MTIRSILSSKPTGVVMVPSTATVANAAGRMLAAHVSTLVVMAGSEVAALLSERDIVSALARNGSRALEMEVRDVVQHRIVTISPDDSPKQAMRLMMRHRVRDLLVFENGRPVGIIGLSDVITHLFGKSDAEATVPRGVAVAVH